MQHIIKSSTCVEGSVTPPGDKSISHRALLLNSISDGTAHITNLCVGDDRSSMIQCLKSLGTQIRKNSSCSITQSQECFEIKGRPDKLLTEPSRVLNAGNSGTTMRLVTGLLAAQPFFSVITGDRFLNERPMGRIIHPLNSMGANVIGRSNNSLGPLAIQGNRLNGIEYTLPTPSAQIKSSILIAGLYAQDVTTIHQPSASRNHTELMMKTMGADINIQGLDVSINPSNLSSINVQVPSDISSAAFWIVAASCHPNARIKINGVGINPYRTGILDILSSMGANITIENIREHGKEPCGDITVQSSNLKGTELSGDIIPKIIDELPILALAACFAKGVTTIRDAQELRVKESDRIKSTVQGLTNLGARIEELPDGMIIHGEQKLKGGYCKSFGDHRVAMTMGIAGMLSNGETIIDGAEAVNVSYPMFWNTLEKIQSS